MLATLLLLASALLPLPDAAQGEEPKGPLDEVFLIRAASVWHADGSTSGPHDLLLRNGLIERVSEAGEALGVVPEAREVDAGEDWVVYPGLIHAAFDDGIAELPDSPYPSEATDPRQDPIPAMEWGNRKDLNGWVRIADHLEWDDAKGEKWREHGFTSAYLVPQEGLVRGRAAWVSFNARPLGQALLQRDGLLSLSLETAGRGYPRTPMAALAVLRQAFLDARRLEGLSRRQVLRLHADPDLRELWSDRERPLLFHADRAREIENALDLARDFAAGRRLVILGGRDAHKHATRLLATDSAVVFELDLDEAPKSDEELKLASLEERPYWQEPRRLREERRADHRRLVESFRLLRESGVPCALAPSGSRKSFHEALPQLVADGLPVDALIASMSSDVASVLGLEGCGRVEEGLAADLMISRGPWDPEKPKLAWVFADGRGWEFPAPDGKGEDGAGGKDGAAADADPAINGVWEMAIAAPDQERKILVTVNTRESSVLIAQVDNPGDTAEGSNPSFDGNTVRFEFTVPELEMNAVVELAFEGDDAEGSFRLPFGSVDMQGKRVGELPEGEQAEAEEQEADPDRQAEEDAEEDQSELGHPEHPVETRADRVPITRLEGDVLLRGGTLYPMTGEAPSQGDLLIRDGRIAARGGGLEAPPGVPVLDAEGWHLMPGVIDAHSHLALSSINEGSVSISAECRIADMIVPESVGIWRAAAGGTAVVQSLHGSANPVGGQAAVWEMDSFKTAIAELLLPGARQGIKFALGENVKQSNGSRFGQRFPNSRSGVEAVYRRAFTRAREYAAARRRHARGEETGFRRDVRLEVLADILEGKIHIQCHSYRADELLMFLRLCEDFGIEAPTFQHVLEGYKVAPELAAAGAMASTFSDWWAYKIEAYDAIPWNVALMHRAGVIASINSDSSEMIRRLNTEAGKSLLYGGLSYDEAMAGCTLNSARQLHVADRLGTLEVGKDGTVTAYDAPPLSTYARCMLTLARGEVLFQRHPEDDARWQEYDDAVAAFARELAAAREAEAVPEEGAARIDGSWEPWIRNGLGYSYLIRNAVVHPVSGESFEGGVLIQDGRIRWVGQVWDGPLPRNTELVDAGGQHLYPGFLNGTDTIGLYEIGSVRGTRDDQETGDVQPDLSIASAIHADSAHHQVHRLTGITHVLVRSRRGLVSGQATLIQLDGETTWDMVTVEDLGLVVNFPRVSAPDAGKAPEEPESLEDLNEWLDKALAYGERHERIRANGGAPRDRDLKLEALLPYARGEKPVLVEADGALTLMAARAWVRERGLDVIYLGARDGWKIAGYLGADGARVITGPVHRLPAAQNDPFESPYRNAGILAAAGCKVALRTNDPEITRNLPFQAATAAVSGWSRAEALHALTLGAAEILGVAQFTGSIEVGKAANLFLTDGDPLDFQGAVRRMWIGGREVELSSKQTELRDRYARRIERTQTGR